MKLREGTPAPDFALPDIAGKRISLSSLRGALTLVQFHRFAGCPACNVTVRDFVRKYSELRAGGLQVVMVFHSPVTELAARMACHDSPFSILADPDEHAYRAFGVSKSWLGMLSPRFLWKAMVGFVTGFAHIPWFEHGGLNGLPGDFLIDGEGIVRAVHYGRGASDTWTPETVLELARGLEQTSDAARLD